MTRIRPISLALALCVACERHETVPAAAGRVDIDVAEAADRSGAPELVPPPAPSVTKPSAARVPEAKLDTAAEEKREPIAFLDDVTSETVLTIERLQELYPGYTVDEEPSNLSLTRGKQLVAMFQIDAQRRVVGYTLYAKGPKVAGTNLQIGASFDDVASAVRLDSCVGEIGEDTVVDCRAGRVVFSWIVGRDEADGELSIARAKTVVGKRPLATVADFGPVDAR